MLHPSTGPPPAPATADQYLLPHQGPSLSAPARGRRRPPCAVGFSPKVLAFPLSWTLRRGSFLGLGRAWACDPHRDLTPASLWGPASLSPSLPARTHLPPCRGGRAPGAHPPTPSLRGIPFLLPDSASPCWNFNVLPCSCTCPQGGGWSPHQLLPVTCLCICPHQAPSGLILVESLVHWMVLSGQ